MKVEIYTDGGSRPVHGVTHGGWGVYVKTDSESYITYGGCGEKATNNHAEAQAADNALQLIIDNKWEAPTMYCDSKYVLDGIQSYLPGWKKRDWFTSAGTPVANKQIWQQVDAKLQTIKAASYKVNYKWVKGHSGNEGNEFADDGATKGLFLSSNGDLTTKVDVVTAPVFMEAPVVTEIVAAPKLKNKSGAKVEPTNTDCSASGFAIGSKWKLKGDKGHWLCIDDAESNAEWEYVPVKVKSVPNPFVCARRLVGVANRGPMVTVDDRHVYMATSYDDTDKIQNRFCGASSGELYEALVISKKQCPIFEALRVKQDEVSHQDVQRPVVYMWDKITSKKNWDGLVANGTGILNANPLGDLEDANDVQYTHYLNVPRLAWKTIDSMDAKLMLLSMYEQKVLKNASILDMDDYIFNESRDEINTTLNRAKSITVPYNDGKKTYNIILSVGIDIPTRNQLAKILKVSGTFTAKLCIYAITPKSFRYGVILEGENDLAMYHNPTANLRMI